MVKKNAQAYDWLNDTDVVGKDKTNGMRGVEVSCKVFHV